MEENRRICSECGAVLTNEGREFDGKLLCGACFDERTVECENCGTRLWSDDAEGNEHHILCSYCFDHYYINCENCGRLIHNDDAYYEVDDDDYPYCLSCYEKREEAPIKTYNYKPKPIFYGTGELFMGVELEIDKGGEYDENATVLQDIANSKETRIYCKHDGSINDGFEIVSHPMTLEYHINNMKWKEIFDKAVYMDYRSHNTETCGLHIHVNRNAFGEENTQEAVIGRIVFFVEKHWNELVKLSRRAPYNLNRWASRYATISSTTKETYDKAKGKCLGRYVAVNLENANTVEFRMFRGTLRYSTFIATLQLVYEICRFAIMLSDRELEEMTWSDFVMKIPPDKKELIEYLKAKRLYVNELPEGLEEI